MTILGVAFLIAAAATLLLRRSAYPWLLAIAAAFPSSAAILLNDNAISPFYLLAIPTLFWFLFFGSRVVGPGVGAIKLFVVWAVFVTALSPIIFAGIRVLSPRNGIDTGVLDPAILAPGISNAAQASYLLIAVGFVFFLVKNPATIHLPAVTFGVGTVLSSANLLVVRTGGRWPSEVFDTGTSIYTNGDVGGISRLRGVFAEPSLLAEFSIAAAVYFFFMFFSARGKRRVAYLILAALAGVNLSASMTGTGTVAAVIVSVAVLVYGVSRFLTRGQGAMFATLVILVGAVAVLLWGGAAANSIIGIVGEKIGSHSQITRSSADLFSIRVSSDTYWIGAGLGSNRPSSFAMMLLSCVGVVGLASFLWLAARIIWHAGRFGSGRAIAWALFSVLVAKVIATPDLSSPILWTLIAACASACWSIAPKAHQKNPVIPVQSSQMGDTGLDDKAVRASA
ncbi:hypothetical protein E3O44_13595 [Cryobacterium algoricola]|uniref:O-antigen ligase domain-containing protein n=1 Tax=Cryobacterium algoricola TaxID=1259183 RepID=A0ABY2IAA9_9MICO|nr:hypothetical protein [Cryobacterium algoricola]TFB85615.1 hypothetical protein E3O44_13595 [Cryobacterium algoricola]